MSECFSLLVLQHLQLGFRVGDGRLSLLVGHFRPCWKHRGCCFKVCLPAHSDEVSTFSTCASHPRLPLITEAVDISIVPSCFRTLGGQPKQPLGERSWGVLARMEGLSSGCSSPCSEGILLFSKGRQPMTQKVDLLIESNAHIPIQHVSPVWTVNHHVLARATRSARGERPLKLAGSRRRRTEQQQ